MGQIYKFFDKHEDLLQEKLKKTACGLDRRLQLTYLPKTYFTTLAFALFSFSKSLSI